MSSNFLGSDTIKISFTWDSTTKTINLDADRIQVFYNLNRQVVRLHKSVLNGTVTKEHLGFYHDVEVYFHDIQPDEYEDTFNTWNM